MCPSGEWKSFQSRCFYNPRSLKISYAGAMSSCQRQGAELAWPDNRVLTKLEQDFIAFGVFGEFHGKLSYWSGMGNRIFSYKRTRNWYYRNKRCGAYRSLLYLDYGQSFKPSCAAPRHFVCELEKGKLDSKNIPRSRSTELLTHKEII